MNLKTQKFLEDTRLSMAKYFKDSGIKEDRVPLLVKTAVELYEILIIVRENEKGHPMHMVEYGMACAILRFILHDDWWDRYIDVTEVKKEAQIYRDEEKEHNNYWHVIALIEMADYIWALRGTCGFDYFVDKVRTRGIKGCFWELHTAQLFYEKRYTVEFQNPNEKRGSSYEMNVIDSDNNTFQVEVKSRGDICKISTLTNALSKSRKQLPDNGNGIICLEINEIFIQKNLTEIQSAIMSFLKNTNRIKYVILLYQILIRRNEKIDSKINMIKIFKNPKFPEVPDLHLNASNPELLAEENKHVRTFMKDTDIFVE